MNFTLSERLQLVLALVLALTTTIAGVALAAVVLTRMTTARRADGRRLSGRAALR